MKDFDLLAILLKPEFGAMLLHGLELTLEIAAGSWLLAMSLALRAAGGAADAKPRRRARRSRPMSPTTATCRRWCS